MTPIPVDLVERLVGPTGLALMVRAQMRNAEFKPMAMLSIRGGRYVAELAYEHPIENETSLLVQLGVMARRRSAA